MSAIEVSVRNTETKGQLSKLRSNGNVPAIIYGGSEKNQTITLSKKQISSLIEKENFASNVITLKLDGNEVKVLPREISFDTVSDEPIHIDFLRIVSGSNINLEIPVRFINNDKSPGLKRGGVLNIVRRKVELKCPTESIPKEIIVDLNELDIGASIKISSVNLPEKSLQEFASLSPPPQPDKNIAVANRKKVLGFLITVQIYSTVTDFARFLGLSTLVFFFKAT